MNNYKFKKRDSYGNKAPYSGGGWNTDYRHQRQTMHSIYKTDELNSRVEKTIFKTKSRGEIMGIKGYRFSKKSGYLRFLAVEAIKGKVECVNSEGVEMLRYVAKVTAGNGMENTVSCFFYPAEKVLRFPSLRMTARINGKWTYWSKK